MTARNRAMHVSTSTRTRVNKAGEERIYHSHLLRRTFRENGKVKHETLANVSMLPEHALNALKAALAGKDVLPVGQHDGFRIERSLTHGHVALVWESAKQLGVMKLLGPKSRNRDIVLGLLIARICAPASKLATINWWADTTIGEDLNLVNVSTDEVYGAMDWLGTRQERIEKKLVATHITNKTVNPKGLAMFDLSSSWVTGKNCELAAFGYSRDGKKGLPQIEYGVMTDPHGRPVAVRVVPGNTADPTCFSGLVEDMKDKYGIREAVMVGDRGMITSARIAQLRQKNLGWITSLRAEQIQKMVAVEPWAPTLFDESNLAEISHPEFPGERLVVCRNPAVEALRARKREDLLTVTEGVLEKIVAQVGAGTLVGKAKIGVRVGRVIGRYNMEKHFILTIEDDVFSYTRNTETIRKEADLDGIYIIRSNVPDPLMSTSELVGAYKQLANVEKVFRSMKAVDLDLRPIYHWTSQRVSAHVFLCMLAAYIVWHLRKSLAPLTYTDENPPERVDPVSKAPRSPEATRKAQTRTTAERNTPYTFSGLLKHLAAMTRNTTGITSDPKHNINILTTATSVQRKAFELIGAPIPQTLK